MAASWSIYHCVDLRLLSVLHASDMLQEIAGGLACLSTEACSVQQLLQEAADEQPVATLPSKAWKAGGLVQSCTA
jgi:hypothetical protein